MDKLKIIEKFQHIVDSQFDKIIKVKIEKNIYRIAIRRDQIPVIRDFKVSNNSLFISFSNVENSIKINENITVFKDSEGEIKGISISQIDKLKSQSYRIKLNRLISEYIKSLPENDTTQSIFKHKQNRIAHALSEIIEIVPETDLK
jgi:uncharacterized protein YuzE